MTAALTLVAISLFLAIVVPAVVRAARRVNHDLAVLAELPADPAAGRTSACPEDTSPV
ncbi:hypothetical protein [Micromonospora rifamycinica]|uniref:Uncharacterized protein n=1 Tax=Micromonospora rifamycinica TaxID=291594 RepID=A0A1C5I093_9ACTN|nr:hypothetical protein [Micromonospora rifamycinica]SCG51662.1 hypothetical protein GA0070623_1951 [Micromonospora rifamycinica]